MEYIEENKALSKAKIQLMARPDSVFFTTLCFSLNHRFTDEVSTAATDGRNVMYNPTYFMGLTVEQRVFILLHETLHCAYLHMLRLAGKVHRKWNIATDHVINLQLIERGFHCHPNWLQDSKYAGMSADEVYKLLPEEDKSDFEMDLQEPGGDVSPELEEEITDIVVRASIQSKMSGDKPGTIPGDIEIFLNKLLKPKLPWYRILQKYMQNLAKSDYTFKVPNRRFFPKYHMPTLIGESLIDVVFALDISASVSDSDFLRFVSEIHSVLRMMKPAKMTLVQFDTKIQSVDEIHNVNELIKIKFSGRGGTDIRPVANWANENKPKLMMIFTDGEFRFGHAQSNVDTIWLIHQNPGFTAPWGKIIHYEI